MEIRDVVKTKLTRVYENADGKQTNDYIFEGECAYFGGDLSIDANNLDKNQNRRYYSRQQYLRLIQNLQPMISECALAGSLDHPGDDDDDEDLSDLIPKMREISHRILALWYDQNTDTVKIKIKLIPTSLGKDAIACADAGMPIYISSRASGYVEDDGRVDLDMIYTYDIVYQPGFQGAKMSRVFESIETDRSVFSVYRDKKSKPVNENADIKTFKKMVNGYVKKLSKSEIKENFGQEYVDKLTDYLHENVGYPNATNKEFYSMLDRFDEWCMTYDGSGTTPILENKTNENKNIQNMKIQKAKKQKAKLARIVEHTVGMDGTSIAFDPSSNALMRINCHTLAESDYWKLADTLMDVESGTAVIALNVANQTIDVLDEDKIHNVVVLEEYTPENFEIFKKSFTEVMESLKISDGDIEKLLGTIKRGLDGMGQLDKNIFTEDNPLVEDAFSIGNMIGYFEDGEFVCEIRITARITMVYEGVNSKGKPVFKSKVFEAKEFKKVCEFKQNNSHGARIRIFENYNKEEIKNSVSDMLTSINSNMSEKTLEQLVTDIYDVISTTNKEAADEIIWIDWLNSDYDNVSAKLFMDGDDWRLDLSPSVIVSRAIGAILERYAPKTNPPKIKINENYTPEDIYDQIYANLKKRGGEQLMDQADVKKLAGDVYSVISNTKRSDVKKNLPDKNYLQSFETYGNYFANLYAYNGTWNLSLEAASPNIHIGEIGAILESIDERKFKLHKKYDTNTVSADEIESDLLKIYPGFYFDDAQKFVHAMKNGKPMESVYNHDGQKIILLYTPQDGILKSISECAINENYDMTYIQNANRINELEHQIKILTDTLVNNVPEDKLSDAALRIIASRVDTLTEYVNDVATAVNALGNEQDITMERIDTVTDYVGDVAKVVNSTADTQELIATRVDTVTDYVGDVAEIINSDGDVKELIATRVNTITDYVEDMAEVVNENLGAKKLKTQELIDISESLDKLVEKSKSAKKIKVVESVTSIPEKYKEMFDSLPANKQKVILEALELYNPKSIEHKEAILEHFGLVVKVIDDDPTTKASLGYSKSDIRNLLNM